MVRTASAPFEIRASAWQTYTIEATSPGTELTVWLHDGYSENDNTTGTIRLDSIALQRDETGQGGWGPNLLSRGNPDTYQYVDQVGAARLDEIMRHDARAFKTALAAWEEREKFIADQKSTLVISYRWTRYNDYLRSFNPLWRIRDWAAKK